MEQNAFKKTACAYLTAAAITSSNQFFNKKEKEQSAKEKIGAEFAKQALALKENAKRLEERAKSLRPYISPTTPKRNIPHNLCIDFNEAYEAAQFYRTDRNPDNLYKLLNGLVSKTYDLNTVEIVYPPDKSVGLIHGITVEGKKFVKSFNLQGLERAAYQLRRFAQEKESKDRYELLHGKC